MNKQNPGIEWTHVYGSGTGFTWNPVQGCQHECKWTLPNGDTTQCYAKSVAERFQSPKFMSDGFASHYWHPERLDQPLKLKTPAGIFLDSFSDLMGWWVPRNQIEAVLDVCYRAEWHTFQLLTKNAPRLAQFTFPKNVWVGASVPPSSMNGKAMSLDQQRRMLNLTLRELSHVNVPVRWLSIEPLSFDVSSCLDLSNELDGGAIQWAVIGAATNGGHVFQPESLWVNNAISSLRKMNARIFFKGNLRGNEAAAEWLEEFPETTDERH